MAYADRNTSGSKIVAIVMVAIIVAGLGYAFVTGLAYQYIKKKAEELNTFDVSEPPPPPEEVPPPPPPDSPVPPPPTQVYVPPAQVAVPAPAPVIQQTNTVPPAPPIIPPAPPAPPAPPPPPAPPRIAKKVEPRGSPQGWVTNDDYPNAAIRAEQAGTTSFRLDVDATGRVTNCTITGSSGSSLLDSTACNLLKRRARFSPAEDASGNKIPSAWSSRFTWRLPEN
ncbi:TonB family protein [Sphingomonas sp.]|uniref:TonB family protein n=1 Tax=Sphingomonas sp. TaxID=28214 RepID=UPI001AFE89AC|nr:TonB family protein [Sphingomonas sp.]MBO9712762.1 TonB family protein [Sphingomonas sp.]